MLFHSIFVVVVVVLVGVVGGGGGGGGGGVGGGGVLVFVLVAVAVAVVVIVVVGSGYAAIFFAGFSKGPVCCHPGRKLQKGFKMICAWDSKGSTILLLLD